MVRFGVAFWLEVMVESMKKTPAVGGEAKKKRVRMHCLGLPPVHTIGGAATVITTRIADRVDRVKPKKKQTR